MVYLRRVIGISGSLIWPKILMELIFNPCGELKWSPEGPVSQIHSPHLHAGTPGIFSDFLGSVQMLKRERGAKSNGKLPHLFISSKTATLVPGFAVEDLPLGRTATFVPEFAKKDLHLGRTLWLFYQYLLVVVVVWSVDFLPSSSAARVRFQAKSGILKSILGLGCVHMCSVLCYLWRWHWRQIQGDQFLCVPLVIWSTSIRPMDIWIINPGECKA